jgi:alpha,alpha-trehalase
MFSVDQVYGANAKLVEKYDVVNIKSGGGGEYPTQDGFGWTNGVMRKLMALYPADAERKALSQCPQPAVEP